MREIPTPQKVQIRERKKIMFCPDAEDQKIKVFNILICQPDERVVKELIIQAHNLS